jgi:hypothetical protein
MQDNDEVPLEDMIAVEQVAQELWRKATKGSAGIVRARQAGVEEPRTHGGHHLAQTSRSAVSLKSGVGSRNQAPSAVSAHIRIGGPSGTIIWLPDIGGSGLSGGIAVLCGTAESRLGIP